MLLQNEMQSQDGMVGQRKNVLAFGILCLTQEKRTEVGDLICTRILEATFCHLFFMLSL